MQYSDPDLFGQLFRKIGDLYMVLWTDLISRYSDLFVFFRMGDDLGYKTSTLMAPEIYRKHLFPQYKRIVDLVHRSGKKFLLHSCGNIFSIMDDLIELGIDAKHSNEDDIAPFSKWIGCYGDRIGLFGGIDVNTLCLKGYDDVYQYVVDQGTLFRKKARGYGLGSGNSIASYVPEEGFIAMIDAAKEIRRREESG
jgi:uroporphyrinogen decarboxylase